MRLLTVRWEGGTRAARQEGDDVVLLDAPDVGTLLATDGAPSRHDRTSGARLALGDVELAPVIPAPSKIICVGVNYASHAAEVGRAVPAHPSLFAKFSLALTGAFDPIPLPPPSVSSQVDWEVELAVVIGTPVRSASSEQAQAAISGVTILNDISMRDWQTRTPQVLAGKNFERCSPLGPVLVTVDEIDTSDLALICAVDDQVMQEGRTSDMVFSPADLVAHVSTFVTLEPGDVISTGTPSGVGAARTPPVFLRAGQVVRSKIEGIGEMVNVCVASEEAHDGQ